MRLYRLLFNILFSGRLLCHVLHNNRISFLLKVCILIKNALLLNFLVFFLKKWAILGEYFLILSFQYTVTSKKYSIIFANSNHRPLVSLTTALLTEPRKHCPNNYLSCIKILINKLMIKYFFYVIFKICII